MTSFIAEFIRFPRFDSVFGNSDSGVHQFIYLTPALSLKEREKENLRSSPAQGGEV